MPESLIKLEPLSEDAFAPYGDVIEIADTNQVMNINYGLTERHHELARIDVADGNGYPIINIFKSQPVSLPFRVKVMERHPLGSQAFINLKDNPFVVIVAEAGEFDCSGLRAFLAGPDQGVNYRKGTWHHYCLGLNSISEFLVVDRAGAGDNCDEVEIPDDLTLIVNH